MTCRASLSVALFCLSSIASFAAVTVRPVARDAQSGALPRFESAAPIVVNTAALLAARNDAQVRVVDLPVSADRSVTLSLAPFSVFDAQTRWVRVTPHGTVALQPATVAMFRGTVEGEAGSIAFLSVDSASLTGFVRTGGREYAIGGPTERTAAGIRTIAYDQRLLPENLASASCGAPDIEKFTTDHFPDMARLYSVPTPAAPRTAAAQYMARVAFDVDEEATTFMAGRGTDTRNYVATMVGAMTTVYEAEGNVQLTLGFFREWATTDPYNQTDLQASLQEFTDYWSQNEDTVSRACAVLLSKKPFCSGGNGACGLAWLDVLCMNSRAYASVMISGTYPSMDNSVVAHEIGHNFGLRHTHSCWWVTNGYTATPIDMCYPAEDGTCFTQTEQSDGTIMSYCNTRQFTFGTIVGPYLKDHVVQIATARPNCFVPAKKITPVATDIDMGAIAPGTTKDSTFTTFLTNTGQQSVSVSKMSFDGDSAYFHIISGGGSFSLAPNARRSVKVRFSPDSERSYSATLNIVNTSGESPISVNFTGAAGYAHIEVEEGDTVLWETTELNDIKFVSIADTGTLPLTVTSIRITGPDSNAFHIQWGGSPFTLDPNDTLHLIAIKYVGPAGPVKNATLVIESNAVGSPAQVTLVGGVLSGVTESAPEDATLAITRAFPNPLPNGGPATVEFRVGMRAPVSLTVVDVYGRTVATLAGGMASPGVYRARFNGAQLPAGTYFYRLESGGRSVSTMTTIIH